MTEYLHNPIWKMQLGTIIDFTHLEGDNKVLKVNLDIKSYLSKICWNFTNKCDYPFWVSIQVTNERTISIFLDFNLLIWSLCSAYWLPCTQCIVFTLILIAWNLSNVYSQTTHPSVIFWGQRPNFGSFKDLSHSIFYFCSFKQKIELELIAIGGKHPIALPKAANNFNINCKWLLTRLTFFQRVLVKIVPFRCTPIAINVNGIPSFCQPQDVLHYTGLVLML